MPIKPLNTPTFMQIEITNKCNINCIMCKRASMFGSGRHLSFDNFKSIVDKVPTALQIHFQGYGEPLLNPEMVRMVDYAHKKNLWTSTSTNGLLLDKKGIPLLNAGLDEIGISVDGTNKKTYEKIRIGASFEELERNVTNFLDARDEIKPSAEVWLLGVSMKENIDEIPGLIDLARDWDFDGVIIQHVTNSIEDVHENQERAISMNFSESDKKYIREAIKMARKYKLTHVIHSYEYDRKMRCFWPWSGFYINVDGNVSGCSVLYHPVMGNILEQSMEEIWHSEEMQKLREKVKKDICEGCKFHYYNLEYII